MLDIGGGHTDISVYKNDKLSIKISTVNVIPSKKFALVCSFEELVKNKVNFVETSIY